MALAAALENDELELVTDRRSTVDPPAGVRLNRVYSGKFRRYHGRSWWQRLIDLPTLLLNLRDVVLVILGFIQSLWLMLRRRPDVVFLNGGAICLPISFVCRLLGVPYLIHESDVVMGLSNRLAASHAKLILFGLEPGEAVRASLKAQTKVVGIQLRPEFNDPPSRANAKQALGLAADAPAVLITGGSQGAQNLNRVIYAVAEDLSLSAVVFHIVGHGHGDEASQVNSALKPELQPNYRISEYEPHRMMILMAAADVVVTRAGATTLSELAQLGAATVIVPNPMLTGGHQSLNAELFAENGAAVVLSESELLADPGLLSQTVSQLINDKSKRAELSRQIKLLAQPDATEQIVAAVRQVGKGKIDAPAA